MDVMGKGPKVRLGGRWRGGSFMVEGLSRVVSLDVGSLFDMLSGCGDRSSR